MATAKNKRTVTAEVPNDVVERIDARGEKEGRKRNEVINRALVFYLEYAEIEPVNEAIDVPKLKKKGSN
jgi:metal-responsive CopG/Arc/MetJ family transcriptional regulator